MDVFRTFPDYNKVLDKTRSRKANETKDERGMIIKSADDKPFKSSREIKEKVELHRKKNERPPVVKEKGKKLGMAFMEEREPVVSDVGLNDPSDPVTQEKLKTLISSGGIMFGDKERKVLAEILNK